MKRFLLTIGALLAFVVTAQSAVISTNITATVGSVFNLSTNRASLYSVTLSGTVPCTIDFYDCDTLAAPYYGTNYTNAAWVSRTMYATNYVTSMVGYNGYTNYYTNAGVWTLNTTNAASTNALPKMMSLSVGANQAVTYDTDALFARGISVLVSTNVSVTLNYRSGQ